MPVHAPEVVRRQVEVDDRAQARAEEEGQEAQGPARSYAERHNPSAEHEQPRQERQRRPEGRGRQILPDKLRVVLELDAREVSVPGEDVEQEPTTMHLEGHVRPEARQVPGFAQVEGRVPQRQRDEQEMESQANDESRPARRPGAESEPGARTAQRDPEEHGRQQQRVRAMDAEVEPEQQEEQEDPPRRVRLRRAPPPGQSREEDERGERGAQDVGRELGRMGPD